MKMLVLIAFTTALLAGCSSPAQCMAECTAQATSKDASYIAEQNKQALMNFAYEKQAIENADLAFQKTQRAKK